MQAVLLAAGQGVRLKPFTDNWPKCLMPISGRPLLEYWLCTLWRNNLRSVVVNVHHHREEVENFITRQRFHNWVRGVYEPKLLGTAGTLSSIKKHLVDQTVLVAHADNWCHCNLSNFIDFHQNRRPVGTALTVMTFRSDNPERCGIVKLDDRGVVQEFHEKEPNPPGNLANGAVYLLEPEVLEWLQGNPSKTDFSTDVLPNYLGQIATWENTAIHRDIGLIDSLLAAQTDIPPDLCWPEKDDWQLEFERHSIHGILEALY